MTITLVMLFGPMERKKGREGGYKDHVLVKTTIVTYHRHSPYTFPSWKN